MDKPGPNETQAGNGFYPPDVNGAISPSQVVITVNLTLNVYTRLGSLLKSVSFNALLGTSVQLSDPRVIFDPIWKRWVVSVTTVPTSTSDPPACSWLAASRTPDARGSWYVYNVCISGGIFSGGDLFDYDQLGFSQDALFLTGNIFACCFTSFKGAAVFAAPKASIYNGLGWGSPVFTVPTTVGTLAPPRIQDSNANAYFLATDSSGTVLDLYRGTNLSNQFQFNFVLQAQISVPGYGVPPNAPQPGVSQVLDTLDGRFQQASAQYGTSPAYLWNTHTENLVGFPTPRFYQIDTTANSIVQTAQWFESGTSNDFNPSITAEAGQAFVTWNTTDTSTTLHHNARIRFSGRQASDPLNTMNPPGHLLITSSVALTGNGVSVQRWGDYSAVTLDPTAPTCGAGNRAAIFNETILDANHWSTQYGLIEFCR